MDALVSTFAHELTEAATDPFLDAWYTARGNENADICAWNFLVTAFEDGYEYNQVGVGGMRFLVQANWDLPTQSCRNGREEISLVPPSPPSPPPPPPTPPGDSHDNLP